MRFFYGFIFLFGMVVISVQAQTGNKKVVAGIVSDQNGKELVAVNVVSKRKGVGTITNDKGYFKLEVDAPDTVVFMFMGMQPRNLVVNDSSETIQLVNVMLQTSSVILKEVEISPFLSKQDLSYDKLPMDATESTRYQLRQHAKHTNKTYFETVGFNFAPLLLKQVGKLGAKIEKAKDRETRQRISIMKQQYAIQGDSIFSKGIPMDSLRHPSHEVFTK
ncbi:carboxypeptidase-like regulatory domain-containing protein [Saccharicrinis sp. FJH54]|uniref:carboxypeptidase-like regulatory domain-containing protein n=1 Tax=Saccharicrinis sp. FJH54 TaxID=3344665 RepID=UPI0035D4F95D